MSQVKYQALEVLILYQSVGQFRPVFQIGIDIYEKIGQVRRQDSLRSYNKT